jgi:cytochrome P450
MSDDPLDRLTAMRRSWLDPFPSFRRHRAAQPVGPIGPNTWAVFRYDDVSRVLSESSTFSSRCRAGQQGSLFADSLIDSDPPRQLQLRALVSQAFTPKSVEALTPRIAAIADELLDRALPPGRMEVIRELAAPLPAFVIAEMLGLPRGDWGRLKDWSDRVVSVHGGAARTAYDEMAAYFVDRSEERRREPRDDLISRLQAAQVGDDRLTTAELTDFCSLLLISGHETTTHAIANALRCVTEHPGAWERLRDDPALLPSTIEEVLRYRSPVQQMPRVTRVAARLGGHDIPAGALVVAMIGSANRDEEKFSDSEKFVMERSPNPHIAFGRGIHYCLGAPLARIEMTVVLSGLLERVDRLRIVPGSRLTPFPSSIIHGVLRLPIAFELARQ